MSAGGTVIRTVDPTGVARGLLLFVAGVLLIDAAGLATVAALIWRGHAVGDWISFYAGGTLIRTGNASHLYDATAQAMTEHALFGGSRTIGYPLPAFVALAFAPLTKLSFAASFLVWLAVNVALLSLLLWQSWRWLDRVPAPLRAVFLVCAVSITALEVLMNGQFDLFVLAGCAGCYALLRGDRPVAAGAVLAIALCKPHLVGAVVLLLLCKREWRALGGFAAVGGLLLIMIPLTVGPRLVVDQLRPLISPSDAATGYGLDAAMMINIRGTVTSLTGSSNVWLWLPPLALIAAVAIAVAVRVWRDLPVLHPQSWALAFVLPLLYSPHVHGQSLVLLIGAAALYLIDSRSSDRPVADFKFVLYPLILMTALWALSLWGVSLMALFVMAAFSMFARRWPEPAVATLRPSHRAELALAS